MDMNEKSNRRSPSSITVATDGSPNSVTWNWAHHDAADDPECGLFDVSALKTNADDDDGVGELDALPVEQDLRPSFETMLRAESFDPSPFESQDLPSFVAKDDETPRVRGGGKGRQEKVEWKELSCDGNVEENREVEWKDVSGMFGEDKGKIEEGGGGGKEAVASSRGMKRFMSRVTLNPKLKNFVSSRFVGTHAKANSVSSRFADTDAKANETEVDICDDSVEISLFDELGRGNRNVAQRTINGVAGHESNLATTEVELEVAVDEAETKIDETFDDAGFEKEVNIDESLFEMTFNEPAPKQAVSDVTEASKANVCTSTKAEEDSFLDGTASNTKSSNSDVLTFDSGEREELESDGPCVKGLGKHQGLKKFLSQVKLNPKLQQVESQRSLTQVKLNPNPQQVKFSRSRTQVKLNSRLRSFGRNNSTVPQVVELDVSKDDDEKSQRPITSDEFEVDTYPITRAIYQDILAKDSTKAAFPADEAEGDNADEDDSCVPEAPACDSGEKRGGINMTRLASRVKLNSRLKSFRRGKTPELNLEETIPLRVSPCVNGESKDYHKLHVTKEDALDGSWPVDVYWSDFPEAIGDSTEIVESVLEELSFKPSNQCADGIVKDDAEDDEVEVSRKDIAYADELETLNGDESCCSRSSKAGSSCTGNMSVSHESRNGSVRDSYTQERAACEGRTMEETKIVEEETKNADDEKEKLLDFRRMEVTLKFKALAGVSQVSSRINPQHGDGIDDTVKAVVTYRQNTIASDRFVSTHVPSLPIFLEPTPDEATAQVFARWPAGQKDDESNSTTLLMSSVRLTRTVRRVGNLENLSNGATAGESQVQEPEDKDSKQFLASLSKAFAPELLDLQIGLMTGSGEIIPLGIATVVIPGEYKRMELDIPVVRNYHSGENASSKNKIYQIRGITKSAKDNVFFSSDRNTKYKVNEGAFLRLELNIAPAAKAPAVSSPTPRHLNSNNRKAEFKYGPINQALRRRRKMDQLLGSKKLSLHQRIQLALEFRSRKCSKGGIASPTYRDVLIARQTEVSEVSCDMPSKASFEESEVDDMTQSLIMDQYDSQSWASSALSGSINPRFASKTKVDAKKEDARLRPISEGPTALFCQPLMPSGATADTIRQGGVRSRACEHSGAGASCFGQPTDDLDVSVSSFVAKENDGRLSPGSQYDENQSHFSSSLYSVFTTDHPQKHTIAESMMDLLLCEGSDLCLCKKERDALEYFAIDQEERTTNYSREFCQEEKIAQFCATFLSEESGGLSVQGTYEEDEDTFATLESLSAKG